MFELVRRILWGSPIRKAVSILVAVVVMPAWVFNFENWLEANGYNLLLTDRKGPVLKFFGWLIDALLSTELRWLVAGALVALVAEGIWRFRRDKPIKSPQAMNREEKVTFISDNLAQIYKSIGFCLGAKDQLSYQLCLPDLETKILGLARNNAFAMPDLRKDGPEAGVLRALCYFNAISPGLRIDDDDEVRRSAKEIVPKIDRLSLADLRAELGLVDPQTPGENKPKAIAAVSNMDAEKPHYEYPKAVLQIEDVKITRSAMSDGQLTSTEGEISVKSECYMQLKHCEVRPISLTQNGLQTTMHGVLFTGRDPHGREIGQFSLPAGQSRKITLVTRDLKDVVSKPPFLLRFAERKLPLEENATYILTLDLCSEAADVTRAQIEIETRVGANFSLTLLDQAVKPR